MTFYNDNDPFVARWLGELVRTGSISQGEVSAASITDIGPERLRGYRRVHLFAGIGGWDHALSLSGWPPDREVWTGSCPCQPFSSVGRRTGTTDPRHLWPQMLRLVSECHPPTVFGEQVASADGRKWLSGVRSDLEALGYAVGCADLCAASVAAPHGRSRLWWVASLSVEDSQGQRRRASETDGKADQDGPADADAGTTGQLQTRSDGSGGTGYWGPHRTVRCRDGFGRRAEPGTLTVVDGFPERVDFIHGYGNAVVPQVAALFVRAFLEAEVLRDSVRYQETTL